MFNINFYFSECPVYVVGAGKRDAAEDRNAIITNHSQTMVFTNIITRLPVQKYTASHSR